jgi:hypothetical protein
VRPERSFDDLARALAEPMRRRRAVRVIGASLVAIAVPGISPPRAKAFSDDCETRSGRLGSFSCSRFTRQGTLECKYCGFPFQRYQCLNNKCVDGCKTVARATGKTVQPTWSAETDSNGRPLRFECCPVPDTIPRDGKCLPSCESTHGPGTYPCGQTCCKDSDYCCDRIFTFRDPYCCGSEEADKARFKDAEVALMIAGGALIVVAAAATGGLAVFLAGSAAAVALWTVPAKIAGDDPPDARYKELFRPRVPSVTPVPREGLSPAAARALDRMLANRLRSGAYALAWIRSIEKAQGADQAGDKAWARRHRATAAGYAREAATTLERDTSLSTAALRQLQRGGFVDTGVTLAQARQWQRRVRQRGLPAATTRVLRAAGVEEARIAAFRTAVERLDPKLVVGVGAFGSLTDRRLAAANTALIKVLRQASRK